MTIFPKFKLFRKLKIIGCGCLLIILVLIILGVLFSGVIIRKLITGAIQQKTGVTVNVDNLNQGKVSYTDPKTGATINLGVNKIPDNFPKDFPIYPGATVTSSQTGQGFWLTLTTNSDANTVASYYQNALSTNGWTAETSATTSTGTSQAVSKGNLNGYLTIDANPSASAGQSQTSIIIVLAEVTK